MNECKKNRDLFEKVLNNGLDKPESEKFFTHLSSCSACAVEFKELKNTLNIFQSIERPEPAPFFLENFWDTLEPKLLNKKAGKTSLFQVISNWWAHLKYFLKFKRTLTYQLSGGIILLIAGMIIGRYFIGGNDNTPDTTMVNNNSIPEENYSLTDLTSYIDRSKVLLLTIMNYDPSIDDIETVNLVRQQQISKELLAQADGLKDRLKDVQLKNLVSDIEIILLQIANLEIKYDLTGIELIQEGVNNKGIILKINIQEMHKVNKEYNKGNENAKTKNASTRI